MDDNHLSRLVDAITDRTKGITSNQGASSLLQTNKANRSQKMIQNYSKYQDIWYQNLDTYEHARSKICEKGGQSKNHKVN